MVERGISSCKGMINVLIVNLLLTEAIVRHKHGIAMTFVLQKRSVFEVNPRTTSCGKHTEQQRATLSLIHISEPTRPY